LLLGFGQVTRLFFASCEEELYFVNKKRERIAIKMTNIPSYKPYFPEDPDFGLEVHNPEFGPEVHDPRGRTSVTLPLTPPPIDLLHQDQPLPRMRTEVLVLSPKIMNVFRNFAKAIARHPELVTLAQLKTTGLLDPAVEQKIAHEALDGWVDCIARECPPILLAGFFRAACYIPSWTQAPKICKIISQAATILSKKEIQDALPLEIKKTFPFFAQKQWIPLIPHIHEIFTSPPPAGIPNPRSVTCWMNSLVELLRTTTAFDSLHDPNIPAHNCFDGEEKQFFEILRNVLHRTVLRLREKPHEPLSAGWVKALVWVFYRAGVIDNPHRQHDATEVLSSLEMHLGNIEEMKIDRKRVFATATDRIEESTKNAESANYIPLQVTQKETSISVLLANYFHGLPDLGPARFVVRDSNDRVLRTLDSYTHMSDVEKEFKAQGNKHPSNDAFQARQMELIVADHKELPVRVSRAPLTEQSLSLQAAPEHIELRINCIGTTNRPTCDQTIDMGPYLPHKNEPEPCPYFLIAAFCRSGVNQHGAGGHFWFVENRGAFWYRYSDENVSRLSQEAAQAELNQYGYSLLYKKV